MAAELNALVIAFDYEQLSQDAFVKRTDYAVDLQAYSDSQTLFIAVVENVTSKKGGCKPIICF